MALTLQNGICNKCGEYSPTSAGCSHASCGGIFVARKTEVCRFLIVDKNNDESVDYFMTEEHAQQQLDDVYNDGSYMIVEAENE